MNCRDFIDFLMAYVNHDLPQEQATEFERHIRDCPPCVNYLDTYRETVKCGKVAFAPENIDCEEIPDKLVQAIVAARGKSS